MYHSKVFNLSHFSVLYSFNRIDIPPYEHYDKLYDKLLTAIEETCGFAVEWFLPPEGMRREERCVVTLHPLGVTYGPVALPLLSEEGTELGIGCWGWNILVSLLPCIFFFLLKNGLHISAASNSLTLYFFFLELAKMLSLLLFSFFF